MNIIRTENYDEMSIIAAKILANQIKAKPDSVVGLATGSTPIGLYQKLVTLYKKRELDFSQVTSFNLDEYIGLEENHPQSYTSFMKDKLFSHVNINADNIHMPDERLSSNLAAYDERIRKSGGIDMQLLGIGENGHIGFNEPTDYLTEYTHIVELSNKTIEANSRFFPSLAEVPKKAITMGVGSIMKAKRIVLLASGREKAKALHQALNGQVTTKCPASFLQLHTNVTFVIDKQAAYLLENIPKPPMIRTEIIY